jgi:hypothetical protein
MVYGLVNPPGKKGTTPAGMHLSVIVIVKVSVVDAPLIEFVGETVYEYTPTAVVVSMVARPVALIAARGKVAGVNRYESVHPVVTAVST